MASVGPVMSSPSSQIFRMLLDARTAFPYPSPPDRLPTGEWASTEAVATALALLPPEEKARVERYFFPKDAALSLASYLLKHLAISKAIDTPWSNTSIRQQRTIQNGKPFYEPGGVEFNVSHHGEAAVVIATTIPGVKVGIDLVRIDTDKDLRVVRQEGWASWVRTYRDVFSDIEVQTIMRSIGTAGMDDEIIKAALRCFYAHWGLKEAYVKMTGDSLQANYLRQLKFSGVEPPSPASEAALSDDKWAWGASTRPSASLRDQQIEDLQLELLALGEHYMVATAIHKSEQIPPFTQVEISRDIMPVSQRWAS